MCLRGPRTRGRVGYDDIPDFRKLSDGKNIILCFSCGKSSGDRRDLIPCDYCSTYWHLDCLDPPLANPPYRGHNAKSRNPWMCPNHVDHDLRQIDPLDSDGARQDGISTSHRVRRIKAAKTLNTALRRGFRNNGMIEVDSDDESDDNGFESEERESGVIYKLPAKGIKLDFIDRIKRLVYLTCFVI